MKNPFKRFLRRSAAPRALAVASAGARPLALPAPRKPLKVGRQAVARASVVVSRHTHGDQAVEPFTVALPPPGVVNRSTMLNGQKLLAMDDMQDLGANFAQFAYGSYFKEGLGFLGYPYLAELSQRAEYRRPVEIIAKEMTRKWIKFTVPGDDGKSEVVEKIEEEFKRLKVKELFRKSAEGDGYQGRHHLFVDTGNNAEPQELMRPMIIDPRKYVPGFLKGIRSVEAIWAYPSAFNATDPLDADYYKPQQWYVQGRAVHTSRLLTFVSRPLPDILKPAYCFGGLALTQIMKPYVDNWLETRQSVNDIIQAFSQPVLKTDMAGALAGDGGEELFNRVDLFNRTRNNRGTMVLDMNNEDFVNVSAPIAGLDKLQAQAQEHMAAVAGIPLVVLLGVTPSGLNASSDGEIRTFYTWIKDLQEQLFLPNLTTILHLVQLNLFGQIDPSIGIEFEPLWEDDAATKATTEKTKADTATAYINAGVIAPEEERERIAQDEDSMYQGVDLSGPPPEPPEQDGSDGDPLNDPDDGDGGGEGADPFAHDEGWREEDHPRAENGQFGSGAGGVAGAHAEHAQAQKAIPAEHFSAAAYAGEHNDPGASVESVLSEFPADTRSMLDATSGRVKARGQTIDRHRVEGQGEHALYTAERQAVQRDVLEKPFTDKEGKAHPPILNAEKVAAARPAPGQRPVFMMLGGRGGSGKSRLAGTVYDPAKFLVLDADEIKQRLPEYEGWNANEVHEESADILERALTFARLNGLNVVLDATLKSLPGAMEKLKTFQADGYEVETHYMHLPRQEAAKRAIGRFLTKNNDGTGRFVPPEVVLGNTANEANFDALRQLADRWSFHDNHVGKNEAPRLISRGAKSAAEIDATRRSGRP